MRTKKLNLTDYQIKSLKSKHEGIRKVLIDHGCKESGDCIIDEICEVLDILPTTVYYVEEK